MTSDLAVTKLLIPLPVRAPCPTRVLVEITNVGPDPAPFPFDVAVDIPQNVEGPFVPQFAPTWIDGEGGLGPNQVRMVSFEITFPCQPQALLRATADYSQTVFGNIRKVRPTLVIPVSNILQVAWLSTTLRVGLERLCWQCHLETTAALPGKKTSGRSDRYQPGLRDRASIAN